MLEATCETTDEDASASGLPRFGSLPDCVVVSDASRLTPATFGAPEAGSGEFRGVPDGWEISDFGLPFPTFPAKSVVSGASDRDSVSMPAESEGKVPLGSELATLASARALARGACVPASVSSTGVSCARASPAGSGVTCLTSAVATSSDNAGSLPRTDLASTAAPLNADAAPGRSARPGIADTADVSHPAEPAPANRMASSDCELLPGIEIEPLPPALP